MSILSTLFQPKSSPAATAETGVLRLVLGVGRSGTSWVSQVLGKTPRPCRFFSEPLFHIEPRLPFHREGDHTATRYEKEISSGHPLAAAYRLLLAAKLKPLTAPALERNDSNWEICLVKEVHALLGTEGLLRLWNIPVIFLLRDPIYIIDSLFAAQTLQTIYLDHESRLVQEENFLERFVPSRRAAVQKLLGETSSRPERQKIVLQKLICAQLLQNMFSVLAAELPSCRALRYEEVCQHPRESFREMAQFLSLPWDDSMNPHLDATMRDAPAPSDPYSIVRNTAAQTKRALKFLSDEEAALCQETLNILGA